jgi:hypothetical protein
MTLSSTDPYADIFAAAARLMKEWDAHDGLVIGVDFDDTINDYHGQGFTFPRTILAIQQAQYLGCTICSWTANDQTDIQEAYKALGITIDHHNSSPIDIGKKSPKPYFNLLLDDRAGLGSALTALEACIKLKLKE